MAGSLKRGDPNRAEDQVLMRALRDFNIPKIVTDDLPVFMGLIGDLFPALDVPRKRDLNFEKVRKAQGGAPLGVSAPTPLVAERGIWLSALGHRSSSRAWWSCGCRPRTALCSRWYSWRSYCKCDTLSSSLAMPAAASPR